MQKQSSKSESTWKTEQNRSCWKILTMVKVNGQRMTCADVAVRRHLGLTWQDAKCSRRVCEHRTGVWGVWGAWRRVATRGACARETETSAGVWRRVWCSFWLFLVLLGIGCSVFLCIFFGSWVSRTLISECCRYCGHDGSGSLLTVTTGWRRGQRKNAGDVHRNQKVRGIALIPCQQYKVREKDWIVCILMCKQ